MKGDGEREREIDYYFLVIKGLKGLIHAGLKGLIHAGLKGLIYGLAFSSLAS